MISSIDNHAFTPVDAEHGAERVSGRYAFVSTRSVLDSLQVEGFVPRSIKVARANKPEREGFQQHVVRLTHEGLLPEVQTRVDGRIGKVGHPEIVLTNSHDALSALRLTLGFFVQVCTNGLVVGMEAFSYRFIHKKISTDEISAAAIQLTQMVPAMTDRMDRMRAQRMEAAQVQSFVREAITLRWRDDITDEQRNRLTYGVNAPRRWEDNGSTLWQVFQRVQENITRGGRYGIRRLNSVTRDVEVNRDLWKLADSYLNN